jgi:hypothetical protein
VSDALPFVRYFADLPDPRVDRTKRRRLDDILVVTRCAAVCGADSFEEIERFGKSRRAWLKGFLALPNGIPSHDTFNRVLAALNRKKLPRVSPAGGTTCACGRDGASSRSTAKRAARRRRTRSAAACTSSRRGRRRKASPAAPRRRASASVTAGVKSGT